MDPTARGGRPLGTDARGATPHPGSPQRRRGLRALPPLPLRGPEAVRAGGRRVGHRPARHHPRRGGARGPARVGDGHGPPWPPQRAGQHRGQVLRRDLRGVRGQPRPRVGPGLRRREVPQGGGRAPSWPATGAPSRWPWPPTRPTSRRSTRWWWAWPGPSRTPPAASRDRATSSRTARASRSRCCPSSSTATPPSPARAWWPRPSTCPVWPATAPVGPSTSSSTTSSASPPRPRPPAPRCTRPTWPRWCRPPSSTSTATTPRPAPVRPDWPSASARPSTRTWSSTWSATAATATTRATTPATPNR